MSHFYTISFLISFPFFLIQRFFPRAFANMYNVGHSDSKHHLFKSSRSFMPSSSTSCHSSSVPLNTHLYHSSNLLHNACVSSLQFPNTSDNCSHLTISHSMNLTRQPQTHLYSRSLHRSDELNPTHLIGSKITNKPIEAEIARHNIQSMSSSVSFHWSSSFYNKPFHIHHATSESLIYSIIQTLAHVHLFTIGTKLDRSSKTHPVPAIIHIQCIHHEYFSTIIVLETQHLPPPSTHLFQTIQQLCKIIFSPTNRLMAWGDIISELKPFQYFNLFDINNLTNTFNIQQHFQIEWNKRHPHINECIARHDSTSQDNEISDYLICQVKSDDIDDDFNRMDPTSDHNTCICPSLIRPFKSRDAVWSIRKAIHSTYDQILDESMKLNTWSSGLDDKLHTWYSSHDKRVRDLMLISALYELFASTKLFFYLKDITSSNLTPGSYINTILPSTYTPLPSFLVLTDSHGKRVPPIINTSSYNIITKSISGLQWVNEHKIQLCTRSLTLSPTFSPLLSSSIGVLFLIGTNSIRQIPALQIMQQIEEIIELIRFHHPHLNKKHDISIVTTFPCYKVSSRFSSPSSLMNNIISYNENLKQLSDRMRFSYVDFKVTDSLLSHDQMHLSSSHQHFLSNAIITYLHDLFNIKINSFKVNCRSQQAFARRNKNRHEHLKQKQSLYTISRPIHPTWHLNELKLFLKEKNIKFSRLPEIYHHQLRIRFNTNHTKQDAEQILSADVFDENHHIEWLRLQHT